MNSQIASISSQQWYFVAVRRFGTLGYAKQTYTEVSREPVLETRVRDPIPLTTKECEWDLNILIFFYLFGALECQV